MLQKTNFQVTILRYGKLRISGRNNLGRITSYHRGGGTHRSFRLVDFRRYVWNVPGVVSSHEYDPNRTALINLIIYANNVACYQLAVSGVPIAEVVTTATPRTGLEERAGFTSYLKNIKPGSYINTMEFKPFGGAQYIRAGGMYAKLVSLGLGFAIVKLRSKFLLKISSSCVATIGVLRKWASLFFPRNNAGHTRRRGFRPSVRGVAMNPVDHPHGGGQGKTSGGRSSVSPWAMLTKGFRTRRKITYGSFILER